MKMAFLFGFNFFFPFQNFNSFPSILFLNSLVSFKTQNSNQPTDGRQQAGLRCYYLTMAASVMWCGNMQGVWWIGPCDMSDMFDVCTVL